MDPAATTPPLLARDVARTYLSIGIALAAVTGAILLTAFTAPAVILDLGRAQLLRLTFYISWSLFCILYSVFSLMAYLRLDRERLMQLTAATDPGPSRWRRFWWSLNGGGAIWWAITGAAVTLYTLVELIASRVPLTPLLTGACITVVVSTAVLIVVAFAVNYAREDAVRGGVDFPGDEGARFGDYLYLSIQLTTTFGGSDVTITRLPMRRIVSMHSVIAFTFNTVIVALFVSVLVGRLT